ncbi:MAG: hypothetical protein AVDCRST_MAG67-626 [uncultured Solirubrobacteraceae bacterium]|uniref:Uncharacterized protein n=1 Tax=uncultured Solirubrobacteraceae bacterium TaxID=1162706 RepID=A0A6J4RUD7_9ACTN|nr:MAG: hypothetical protein AVDCRST_MAG67-626 [uncultured Solirubrobacteraceae bacterium]
MAAVVTFNMTHLAILATDRRDRARAGSGTTRAKVALP